MQFEFGVYTIYSDPVGKDEYFFDNFDDSLSLENTEESTTETVTKKLEPKPRRYQNTEDFRVEFQPARGFQIEQGRRSRRAKSFQFVSHNNNPCPASMTCVTQGFVN